MEYLKRMRNIYFDSLVYDNKDFKLKMYVIYSVQIKSLTDEVANKYVPPFHSQVHAISENERID